MEILTPDEMRSAEQYAIAEGTDAFSLMRTAGLAVAREAALRFPEAAAIAVLAGPGNNGGDGYVAAQALVEDGWSVTLYRDQEPREGSSAALAASRWAGPTKPFADFDPGMADLVIDALYGTGLSRTLAGAEADLIEQINAAGTPVLAVDLPSGISGETGQIMGSAIRARVTVTFYRPKLGHMLYPGRDHCGVLVVAPIGIPDGALQDLDPVRENLPALWVRHLPRPGADAHKYSRGHVAVLSGGISSSGAARLSAEAAARSGAGAVTVLAPPSALALVAAHLTATMVKSLKAEDDLSTFLDQRKVRAVVAGPGLGMGDREIALVKTLLEQARTGHPVVLDADALTILSENPEWLAEAASNATGLVITPHEGEFRRLFPGLADDKRLSKVDRAREAARKIGGVVIYKGADTVIAAPDGRAVINGNGSVWLATAGSGDVLAGVTGSLLAQGMPGFEAACASVWVHAEAGRREGFGLTAEDLPQAVRRMLAELIG